MVKFCPEKKRNILHIFGSTAVVLTMFHNEDNDGWDIDLHAMCSSTSTLVHSFSHLYADSKAKVDTWNTNIASPARRVVPLKKSALELAPKVPEKPKLSAEEIKRLDEER